jgi:hypothetical protein
MISLELNYVLCVQNKFRYSAHIKDRMRRPRVPMRQNLAITNCIMMAGQVVD